MNQESLYYGENSPLNNTHTCLPLLTPVSTAMYSTTATCSWAHTVPSLMPWVPTGEVVRFSAHPDPCTSQTATSWEIMHNSPHLKRKNEGTGNTPHKMYITEEKMAARFQDMHISNEYSIPSDSSSINVKSPKSLQQLEVLLQDSDSSNASAKSLILAPELKKLVEPEKILSTFLNKIEKPSMALMVWQPPKNQLIEKNTLKEEASDKTKNNNNNLQQLSMICQQYLSSRDKLYPPDEEVMEI